MPYTHDTTCGTSFAGEEVTKWADFTDWVKSRVVTSKKDLRRRQIPLFDVSPPPAAVVPPPARGGDAAPGGGAYAPGAAPLVNRCISQHESKKRVLGGVKFEVFPRSVRVVRPFQAPPGP